MSKPQGTHQNLLTLTFAGQNLGAHWASIDTKIWKKYTTAWLGQVIKLSTRTGNPGRGEAGHFLLKYS